MNFLKFTEYIYSVNIEYKKYLLSIFCLQRDKGMMDETEMCIFLNSSRERLKQNIFPSCLHCPKNQNRKKCGGFLITLDPCKTIHTPGTCSLFSNVTSTNLILYFVGGLGEKVAQN